MRKLYQTPGEEVLNRMKRNWTYEGRKPTSLRWDDGPFGGWLMMKFADKPRVVITWASPILFYDVPKAIFPGKMHNPLCQWGDFGDYHITENGQFDASVCLIDRAEYEQEQLLQHTGNEYMYLRSRL